MINSASLSQESGHGKFEQELMEFYIYLQSPPSCLVVDMVYIKNSNSLIYIACLQLELIIMA